MLDITQLNASLLSPVMPPMTRLGALPTAELPGDSGPRPALRNRKPAVTWKVTRRCNLNCANCPSHSESLGGGAELTTHEGMALIKDLAVFGVKRLELMGGEALLRSDLLKLTACAHELGIQTSLRTNGTLLTPAKTEMLRNAGLESVSIWLEGIGREVDRHRRAPGAYQAVLEAYANCRAARLPAEIRTPLNRSSFRELNDILDLVERQGIRKVVFAHQVHMNREEPSAESLTHEETRQALDILLERAEDFVRRKIPITIATDENHADAVYQYLRLARRNPLASQAALRSLPEYGAHVQGAGVGIAAIDSVGDVHPDPYWDNHVLGNVRQTTFSEVWEKSTDPLLCGLRNRLPLLKGRCGDCRWREVCGGNLRVRAQEYYGDPWMADPMCYLTNHEIHKEITDEFEPMEDDVLLKERAA